SGLPSADTPFGTRTVPNTSGSVVGFVASPACGGCWFGVLCCASASLAYSAPARIPTRMICFFIALLSCTSRPCLSQSCVARHLGNYSDIFTEWYRNIGSLARRVPHELHENLSVLQGGSGGPWKQSSSLPTGRCEN